MKTTQTFSPWMLKAAAPLAEYRPCNLTHLSDMTRLRSAGLWVPALSSVPADSAVQAAQGCPDRRERSRVL